MSRIKRTEPKENITFWIRGWRTCRWPICSFPSRFLFSSAPKTLKMMDYFPLSSLLWLVWAPQEKYKSILLSSKKSASKIIFCVIGWSFALVGSAHLIDDKYVLQFMSNLSLSKWFAANIQVRPNCKCRGSFIGRGFHEAKSTYPSRHPICTDSTIWAALVHFLTFLKARRKKTDILP